MPRYIDADALKSRLEGRPSDFYDYDELIPLIDEQPTISPDEVRGVGEWIDNGVRAWSCSCCGTPLNHIRQFASFEKNELPNYCPSCGARMGGVQDALS